MVLLTISLLVLLELENCILFLPKLGEVGGPGMNLPPSGVDFKQAELL